MLLCTEGETGVDGARRQFHNERAKAVDAGMTQVAGRG